ncbi:hypothetical protein AVEN_161709-1, partial [Araneus ventricosus]
SKPDSSEDPPSMWARCMLNHTCRVKRPPAGVVRNFGKGVATQVSLSSTEAVQNDKVRLINQAI